MKNILIYILLVFICSCKGEIENEHFNTSKKTSIIELEDSKTIESIKYAIKYLPPSQRAYNDAEPNDINEYNELLTDYKKSDHYVLRIENLTGDDPMRIALNSKEEYYARVEYYAFQLEQDLVFIVNTDTINVDYTHFERNFGSSPNINISFGIDIDKVQSHDRRIIYYDRVFSKSWINWSVDKKAILESSKKKSDEK